MGKVVACIYWFSYLMLSLLILFFLEVIAKALLVCFTCLCHERPIFLPLVAMFLLYICYCLVHKVSYMCPKCLKNWWYRFCILSFYVLQILTFLQFGGYILVRNSKDLFQSFGFDTQPVLIGLIIFQVIKCLAMVSW